MTVRNEHEAGGRRLTGLSLSVRDGRLCNKQIATVNDRITALEGRVGQVDQAAQAANAAAQAAGSSAQQANQRIDALTSRVDGIEQRLSSKKTTELTYRGVRRLSPAADLAADPGWSGTRI